MPPTVKGDWYDELWNDLGIPRAPTFQKLQGHDGDLRIARDNFYPMAIGPDPAKHFQGYLNSVVTVVMMVCVLVILASAVMRWIKVLNGTLKPAESAA